MLCFHVHTDFISFFSFSFFLLYISKQDLLELVGYFSLSGLKPCKKVQKFVKGKLERRSCQPINEYLNGGSGRYVQERVPFGLLVNPFVIVA